MLDIEFDRECVWVIFLISAGCTISPIQSQLIIFHCITALT